MSGIRIFFWPDRPRDNLLVFPLMEQAGWEFADHPDEADWCVLHRDATWIRPGDADPWEERSAGWINGRCRDISKWHVQETFHQAFGYSLAVDPLTWEGELVQKSDQNFRKDCLILQGPLDARIEGQVYQRLVRGDFDAQGRATEYRALVVGGVIAGLMRAPWWPIEYRREKPLEFIPDWVRVEDSFTTDELAGVTRFCGLLGLDYGKLDIIRDREDGRIYIVDANNTPGRSWVTPSSFPEFRAGMIRVFYERFGWNAAE